MNKELIKIGSDIEVFLQDKTSGKFLSGVGLIGGTKESPRPLDREGCCIQEDNVALEYNVPPVGLKEANEMWENIRFVVDTVKMVTAIPDNAELVCCSSANFDEDQLGTEQAKTFGCEPDFNAWKGGIPNDTPRTANKALRSCGGHIHISYPGASPLESLRLVMILDLFLGVPSVLIDRDTERRKLYGKAGAMRFKEWGSDAGFEYRVLSNWWTSEKRYVDWVFSQISKAFDFYISGRMGVELSGDRIQQAINESDAVLAEILVKEFGIELPVANTVTVY